MGVLKYDLTEMESISYTPKELSDFWKIYFSTISVGLNKLFCKYSHENVSVRYLHRDVIKTGKYLESVYENNVIRSFAIKPYHAQGHIFIPDDMCLHFINKLLGGQTNYGLSADHILTKVDVKILENVLDDIMAMTRIELGQRFKGLEFEVIDEDVFSHELCSAKTPGFLSVQQFLYIAGSQSFVFDIAFTNRFLEQYTLI